MTLPRPAHGDLRLGAALFVASGACGLLYEVVWSRRLELTFGSTVPAVATVLAVYMAGLGLGAWLAGPHADRRDPLSCVRLYALLEALIGAYGVISLALCDAVDALHSAAAPEPGGAGGSLLRAGLAFALLLPPTLAMGATLPLLARALVADAAAGAQRVVAGLYAANTLGAVVGAGASAFLLLPAVGLAGVVALAVAGNVLVAAAAWAGAPRLVAGRSRRAAPVVPEGDVDPALARLGIAAAFVFGLVSLALEVGWTRLLGLVFGSSSAGFALSLIGVLLGIALGSLLVRAPTSPGACAARLAAAALAAGAGAALSLVLWPAAAWAAVRLAQARPGHGAFLVAQLGLGTALVLPAAIAFGAAFPLAVRLGAATGRVGRRVGDVYLANTLGAVLGAGPVAILALDHGGAAWLIAAGASVLLALGVAVIYVGRRRARASLRPVALALVAVAAGAHLASRGLGHPRELWDLGPVVRPRAPTDDPAELARVWRQSGTALRSFADGSGATITVRDARRGRFLTINGKVDASSQGDMPAQLLCGLLPALVHPAAERVLVIGVGSGVTAAAAAGPAVTSLEVVEIEPAVVEAARAHFAPWNLGVLERPGVRVTIADGRARLATDRARHDVVISQPTNPWVAGVASLFTREFHALVRARLAPGGVALQWVQLYSSDAAMCRAQVRTFLEAFPHASAWFASRGDLLLIGSARPLAIDADRARAALRDNAALRAHGRRHLAAADLDDLLGRYVADREALLRWSGQAALLTDAHPRLEAMALQNLLVDRSAAGRPSLMSELLDLRGRDPRPPVTGAVDLARAREAFAAVLLDGAPQRALNELEPVRTAGRLSAAGQGLAGRALLALGRRDEGEALLRTAAPLDAAARLALLEHLLAGDAPGPERRAEAARLIARGPASPRLLAAQARLAAAEARWEAAFRAASAGLDLLVRADGVAEVPVEVPVEIEEALVTTLIQAGFRGGRGGDVAQLLAAAAAARPDDWYLHASWADALGGCGRAADALAAFDVIEARWRVLEPWVHRGRARALLALGRRAEAEAVLGELTRLWPEQRVKAEALLPR